MSIRERGAVTFTVGTHKIRKPPSKEISDVSTSTSFQDTPNAKPLSICGKAVPKTNAPTRKPKYLPKPLLKWLAAILIPTG